MQKKNMLIKSHIRSPSNYDSKQSTQLPRQKSMNQFEEADPNSKDRKIIRMRNVVDLNEQESSNKLIENNRKKSEQDILLEQLDQWYQQIITKKSPFPFEHVKQTENQFHEFTNDGGPQVNQAILNSILRQPEKQQLLDNPQQQQSPESEATVQVKFQMLRPTKDSNNPVLKTLDQVRIEMNKQILNSLLLQKVTKKLDDLQINRKAKSQWNLHKIDEETAQVVRDQSQALKNSTLNNFKGLTEYFSNPAQYIDYDVVLSRAKYYSNKPPNNFQIDTIPTNQQNSTSAKQLMESYQLFQVQIKENKKILYQMRIDNNINVDHIHTKEEEIAEIKRKFYIKEEKARQGYVEQQEGRRKNLMESIEQIKSQRETEVKNVSKIVHQIKEEIHKNIEKQQAMQKELDEIRQKKRRCKMLLKDIFLKQFQDANEQLTPDGLVSIIKNMKKINENAKIDQFPKFLDEQSKQYLLTAAQLELEIEDTRQLSQRLIPKSNTKNNQSQPNLLHQQQINVSQLKNQVKTMLKKSKVSIKKPVFVQGIDPLNPSTFAHVIKWEHQDLDQLQQQNQEQHFKLQNFSSETNLLTKDYNQKLVQIQQQFEKIQKSEIDRILKLYQNKRHLSDVQELKMVLYALFGQIIGDQAWYSFVVEWTDQKSLNPQQLLKKETESKLNQPHKIPQSMRDKLAQTYRKMNDMILI